MTFSRNFLLVFVLSLSMASSKSEAGLVNFTNSGFGASLDLKASVSGLDVFGDGSLLLELVSVSDSNISGNVDSSSSAVPRANSNSGSFGVDASSSLTGDDSDRFDALLSESLIIKFDKDVEFSFINFESFTNGESFSIGGNTVAFNSTGFSSSEYTPPIALSFAAGTPIEFAATAGSIGLEQIQINITAVPEPSSFALIGLFSMGTILVRRKRATV